MWALGNYHAVASEIIASLGPIVVEAAHMGPGQRVHDVAAGSGNVAIPAARTGAEVVATDLTPALLERGREIAEAEGLAVRWVAADAEALPCDEGEFDTVVSCVGVMFAPHHQQVADELVRVVRPGGTIALLSWTPEGFIGQMFATMKPYAPPPPAGAQPPPLWGHVDHVRALLGDRVTGSTSACSRTSSSTSSRRRRTSSTSSRPTTARRSRSTGTSPTTRSGSPPSTRDLLALAERFDRGTDGTVLDWEYLLLTATRA